MSRPQELFSIFADVSTLRGVGEGSVKALTRLLSRALPSDELDEESKASAAPNMPRLKDLLFHLPTHVVDRTQSPPLTELREGQVATFVVQALEHMPPPPRSKRPYKILVVNDTGELMLSFFKGDKSYLNKQLPVGQERVISGRVERYDGYWQMAHPDTITYPNYYDKVAVLEPVYPLTYGLTNKRIVQWVEASIDKAPELSEWIEPTLMKQQEWLPWKAALTALHYPEDMSVFMPKHPARMRLAYDEMLASQLALAMVRSRMKKQAGHVYDAECALASEVEHALPFALTQGQQDVLRTVRADMASGERMLRLLQGDVGSGKTVVALLAGLSVIANGKQVAIMAPTEILTRQHAKSFGKLLHDFPELGVVMLTGSLKAPEKKEALAKMKDGRAQIIIGTHALFQESAEYHDLGLVVVDEQHRFGVAQRLTLAAKGDKPHMLLMTATPIPRSLSMVVYGDMDSSELKEKPAGRQEIKTVVIPFTREEEVLQGVARARERGEKVYWVCPLVEEGEETPPHVKAVELRYAELKARYGERVGLVHGQMKSEERHRVMAGFAADEFDVLVATTVIEVGVDVPEATVIIIENAERFGLAQLHQLRGRVGRGELASSCILLYHPYCFDTAKERLKVIRGTNDGFHIAEEDLRLRGGGEVLGTRQSGLPVFTFADLGEHKDLITMARDDVKLILHRDPELTSERGKALRQLLYLFEQEQGVKLLSGG